MQPDNVATSAPWYSAELEPLLAVAAGALDAEGRLCEANAGLRRLLALTEPPLCLGEIVTPFFLRPRIATLAAAPAIGRYEVYAGAITVGNFKGRPTTLCGRVWRVGDRVLVLAEHDVAAAERVGSVLGDLHRENAEAQLHLAQANVRLRQSEAACLALSLTDQLTGAGNRRRLDEALLMEIARAKRTGDSLCAFMADLDHFKQVNDQYGHAVGDAALRAFAGVLQRLTRPTDVVARFGGEEFVVLMPQTNMEQALNVAERIRRSLATMTIHPLKTPVTVSIGLAEAGRNGDVEMLLRRLDQALYAAKNAGRNRVIVAKRPEDREGGQIVGAGSMRS